MLEKMKVSVVLDVVVSLTEYWETNASWKLVFRLAAIHSRLLVVPVSRQRQQLISRLPANVIAGFFWQPRVHAFTKDTEATIATSLHWRRQCLAGDDAS